MTASARFDNLSDDEPSAVPGAVSAAAPAPGVVRSRAWRRGAGWTVGRVWLAWLVGHAVLVVPLAWSYVADGYETVPYDVRIYAAWGASLAAGDGLPAGDDRWQYPPGAAVVFAVPALADRLVGVPFPVGFVVGMLAVSAAVTVLLLRRRSAAAAGLWVVGVWAVGQVAIARFDLVPAAFAVLALVAATDRQWGRTGWAVGAGALVKAWPVIPLAAVGRDRRSPDADAGAGAVGVGDGDGRAGGGGGAGAGGVRRPREVVSLAVGLAGSVAALAVVAVAVGWWRELLGFLGAQQARGLQLEAVAATPLVLARAFGVVGAESPAYAYGSMQFDSPLAQGIAAGCSVAGVAVIGCAVGWWWGLGRVDGSTVADRCLLLMVLVVVTARVLSPQYLLWLLAVAACRPGPWDASGEGARRLWRRPAVLLLAVALLSQLVYPMTYDGLLAGDLLPSLLLAARNVLLVVLCLVMTRRVNIIRVGGRR